MLLSSTSTYYYRDNESKFVKHFLNNFVIYFSLGELFVINQTLKKIAEECQGDIDAYLSRLEFYDLEEHSILWKTQELAVDIANQGSRNDFKTQQTYGCEDQDLYAVGGVASLDVYQNVAERREYKDDLRATRKLLANS